MEIDWELTEKSAKFIHHGECESWYSLGRKQLWLEYYDYVVERVRVFPNGGVFPNIANIFHPVAG